MLFALSYVLFFTPHKIAPGGVTGIAVTLNYLTNFPLGTLILLLNLPIIALALYKLGIKIVASSIYVIILSSILMNISDMFHYTFTDDILLASIYGGLLQGVGCGLIFLGNATSGGTSMLGRLLRLSFPSVPIGRLVMVLDVLVVLISSLVFKNIDLSLYSTITLYVTTLLTDAILYGSDFVVMAHIISEKPNEIAHAIQNKLTRNVTYLSGIGGYTGKEKKVIYCVVHRSEAAGLARVVRQTDPSAFITIIKAKEVYGAGFKLN